MQAREQRAEPELEQAASIHLHRVVAEPEKGEDGGADGELDPVVEQHGPVGRDEDYVPPCWAVDSRPAVGGHGVRAVFVEDVALHGQPEDDQCEGHEEEA